jgi:hypothetical protein
MRRLLLALPVVAGGAIAWACTAFDFPAPSSSPDAGDAGGESAVEDTGPAPPATLLSTTDAALLCSQLFRCPALGQAIELSLALPVATPPSPLSFPGCVDLLAGPIAPDRIGLSGQQAMLTAVAHASTCSAAAAALPVRPFLDAGTCATGCADLTDYEACVDGGSFVAPCQPPYFGQSGACYPDAGVAICVSLGSCITGLSCTDAGAGGTLVDCYPKNAAFTSYDCALSGRACATLGTRLADCVPPGANTAPCPLDDAKDNCDGTSVRHCAGGVAAQTELDCAAVGRSCTTSNAAGVARCASSSDACTPFDADIGQCGGDAGSSISLCVGGQRASFACGDIQQSCIPAGAGGSGHCG